MGISITGVVREGLVYGRSRDGYINEVILLALTLCPTIDNIHLPSPDSNYSFSASGSVHSNRHSGSAD